MPNWATPFQPMVPRRAIAGLQEALAPGSSASPEGTDWMSDLGQIPGALKDLAGLGLEQAPEAIGGFLSGALEGARGMTTPVEIGAAMVPGGVLARGFGKAVPAATSMARRAAPTIDILEDVPLRQIEPGAQAVDELIAGLGQRMKEIPQATGRIRRPGSPAVQALEQTPSAPRGGGAPGPEFVPRGGEAAYNQSRAMNVGSADVGSQASDPYSAAFDRYQWRSRFGR